MPKVSTPFNPLSMYLAMRSLVQRIIADGFRFDLIDSHFFYPDGVAAILFGREFSRPVVITSLGSNIHLLPHYTMPQLWIKYAADRAHRLVAVSQALKDRMVALGMPSQRITVIPNGVDLEVFQPASADIVRRRYDLTGTVLLTVGNLVPF